MFKFPNNNNPTSICYIFKKNIVDLIGANSFPSVKN